MRRPLRLLRLALEAEGLRLRHRIRRVFGRAAFGLFGIVLMLGALIFGHVAAWYWLRLTWPIHLVALLFAAVDLVLGIVLILLAGRSAPSRAEREARELREQAVEDALESLSFSAMLLRLLDLILARRSS